MIKIKFRKLAPKIILSSCENFENIFQKKLCKLPPTFRLIHFITMPQGKLVRNMGYSLYLKKNGCRSTSDNLFSVDQIL